MNTQDLTENTSAEPARSSGVAMLGQSTCDCSPSSPDGKIAAAAVAIAAILSSCKKDPDVLFELTPVTLYGSAAEKDKLKSTEQFVSILYTNIFQQALSSNQVFELTRCLESIGDKELAREVVISNFFNAPGVIIPTVAEMQADINLFIDNTYKRFFVRLPTEGERTWTRNFIQNNPYMTPELVYFSFALSNEYLYY